MKQIFADTFYWAALLNPKDQWSETARDAQLKLGGVELVTTETVIIELLNYFSEFGSEMRGTVAGVVRDIMADPDVEYVPHSPALFRDAISTKIVGTKGSV